MRLNVVNFATISITDKELQVLDAFKESKTYWHQYTDVEEE